MEERLLLTTTVFLDFGEGFHENPLIVQSSVIDEPFDAAGIQGPNMNDSHGSTIGLDSSQKIEIKSLRQLVTNFLWDEDRDGIFNTVGWDYDADGVKGTDADYQRLKADIVSLVTRQFAPYDISVQVAVATGFADIRATVNANHASASGRNDAYVIVAPMFLVDANGNPIEADGKVGPDSVGRFMGLFGQASDDDLNGLCIDCIYDRNDQDESAFVFAESIVTTLRPSVAAAVELANTASHEAAHTFGLFHTIGPFDVMSTTEGPEGVRKVFSRYPVSVPDDFIPRQLGLVETLNSWEWLKEDDDIGLKPGFPEFVTGTAGDNIITIEREGDHGRVRILYHTLYGETEDFSYPISLDRGVLLEAGPGDDLVRIDPSLGTQVNVVGGPGKTTIVLQDAPEAAVRIRPDSSTRLTIEGLNIVSGSIQFGDTIIAYDEFSPDSEIWLQNVGSVVLETADGPDRLEFNDDRLRDLRSGGTGLTLAWRNLASLTVDTSSRDTLPSRDIVTLTGTWPVQQDDRGRAPFPILIKTGDGDDQLKIVEPLNHHFYDATSQVRWEAGEGSDRLLAEGAYSYALSNSQLVFPDGSLSFDSSLENVALIGTDEEDTFVVSQFSGSATLNGLLGSDQAIITGFENAVVENDLVNPQIVADNATVTLVDVYHLTLEDLVWRTNNVIVSRHQSTSQLQVHVNTGEGADRIVVDDNGAGLTINTGDQADEVIIYDAAAGTVVNTDAGDDVIELIVSNQQRWATWSWIQVLAGMGVDTVRVRDNEFLPDDVTRSEYQISAGEITRTRQATATGDAEVLPYGDAEIVGLFSSERDDQIQVDTIREAVIVDSGSGADAVSIPRVPLSAWAVVRTGVGMDSVAIGDGNYLSSIRGPVSVNGGDDGAALIIDDSEAAYGGESYTLEANSFSKSGLILLPLLDPIIVQGPVISWESIDQIRLDGSRIGSEYNLRSVAPDVTLEVNGGDGNDDFVVGGGRYLATIRGQVSINGGESGSAGDTLFLADNAVVGRVAGEEYEFDQRVDDVRGIVGTFVKRQLPLFPPLGELADSPELSYLNLERVTLSANSADAKYFVNSTLAGTDMTLYGDGGKDEFRIDLGGQRSPVVVYGGAPDVRPGDSLYVRGTGVERPWYKPYAGSRADGSVENIPFPITFHELEPVTLDNFASVTFVSPLSLDFATLGRDGDSLEIVGTSYNPIPLAGVNGQVSPLPAPTPWEVLRVKNTREVTLDLATNDDHIFSTGPFSYAPVPTDHVTIQPGALQTPGLTRVLISSGAGTNVVEDHTLESTGPATASLVINGGFFTARGDTYHLIHGTAGQLEIHHPFAAATVTKVLAADGSISAEFFDLAMGGGLRFLDPQPDVRVDLRHFDAVLREGGLGRQRIEGPQMNPLEIAPTSDGRLVLLGTGAIDVQGVTYPVFDFGPLLGTGLVPSGPVALCVVTNTNDSGPGSLRAALECSSTAPSDTLAVVSFAIPVSDPNFVDVDSHLPDGDVAPDVFVISPLSAFPINFRGRVVINGQSQHALTGDTNPFGPEIVLDGRQAGLGVNGLELRSANNYVHGLDIQGFRGNGIFIAGNENSVTGSYLGTNATGTAPEAALSGAVGWWPGEGSAADVAEDRDGTLVSGTDFAPGIVGQAFRFDGVDDHAAIPDAARITLEQGLTLEAWINTTSADQDSAYAGNAALNLFGNSQNDVWVGFGVHNGKVRYNFASSDSIWDHLDGTRMVNDGRWHHIAATHDESTGIVRIFVDGVLDGSATFNYHSIDPYSIPVAIDRIGAGYSNLDVFDGLVDEPTVFNRVLSASEIASIYRLGSAGKGAINPANGANGIYIVNGAANVIGGDSVGERNIISGNSLHGVQIVGNGVIPPVADTICVDPVTGMIGACPPPVGGNLVIGNFIGVGADGSTPLGNANSGIEVRDSSHNILGQPIPLPPVDGEVVALPMTLPGGNVISANGQDGVTLVQAHENTIQGNYVGVDFLGLEARGNGRFGIWAIESARNQIGGGEPPQRNVISGNVASNLGLYYEATVGNKIQGNYIGLDSRGAGTITNPGFGIDATYNVSFNVFGVDGDGVNDAYEGNIISGHRGTQNASAAIYLVGHDNVVAGNWLGTDATGRLPLGNVYGVHMAGERNRIGADGDGVSDELERNVIADNDAGIVIFGGADHIVAGNFVGTDKTGKRALGNGVGISIGAGVLRTQIGSNSDGVSDDLERNFVSGQGGIPGTTGIGIYVAGIDTLIAGNYVGLGADGDKSLGNASHGVYVADSARGTLIGGTSEAAQNVISANGGHGIYLVGGQGTTVQGNYIGTTSDGLRAMANLSGGVAIENSSQNLIGGTTQAARNIISGNQANGLQITGSLARDNHVAGNYIGLGADGRTPVGNLRGVLVSAGAGNQIGGLTDGERNVISGNSYEHLYLSGPEGVRVQGNYFGTDATGTEPGAYAQVAIRLSDNQQSVIGGAEPGAGNLISSSFYGIYAAGSPAYGGTHDVRIQGNKIGTDRDGAFAIPNFQGIYLDGYESLDQRFLVHDVLIGGTEENAGNLISGNLYGVIARGPNATNVKIQGNLIGTDGSGARELGNGTYGVWLEDSALNQIGGGEAGAGNVISGNRQAGIMITGGGGHRLEGNFVGTNHSGNSAIGNAYGVVVGAAAGVRVGGGEAGAGNVISGNTSAGVYLSGGAVETRVQGNLIGTNAAGTGPLGNDFVGILVDANANSNWIGTDGDGVLDADEGNVISGNSNAGIYITSALSRSNVIAGNIIGLDASGRQMLGNRSEGIVLNGVNHVVGGLRPEQRNIISGNGQAGIQFEGLGTRGIQVLGNYIGADIDGVTARPNGALTGDDSEGGILIVDASSNYIGGSLPSARNVIAGNSGHGVTLTGQASANIIAGNFIGLTAVGSQSLGNTGHGVLATGGASSNVLGTNGDGLDDAAEANIIAFNGLDGVAVVGDLSLANTIRRNSIHSNGDLGIDLADDGVTANDKGNATVTPVIPPDTDVGPNLRQNFPDISSSRKTTSGANAGLTVTGVLKSTPNTTFVIDLYRNDVAGRSGRTWLASLERTTDGQGSANYSIGLPLTAANVGDYLTATATEVVSRVGEQIIGNTSEFSAPNQVTGGGGGGGSNGGGSNGGGGNGGGGNGGGGGRLLVAAELPANPITVSLTPTQLAPLVQEALARWQSAGVRVPTAGQIEVGITDLPNDLLGLAKGHTIWIDATAAGWGWFVDATPGQDLEFTLPGNQGEEDRIDLLTVVMHELGHLLGHDHDKEGVMAETLAAGVRRTDLDHDVSLADQFFRQGGDYRSDAWLGAWLSDQFDSMHGRAKRRR